MVGKGSFLAQTCDSNSHRIEAKLINAQVWGDYRIWRLWKINDLWKKKLIWIEQEEMNHMNGMLTCIKLNNKFDTLLKF